MARVPEIHEFTSETPIEATVRLGGGDLLINATPGPAIRVEVIPHDDGEAARAAAAGTTVEFDGHRLRVETPESGSGWLFKRSGRVNIMIQLPEESRVRAHSGSGDVRIDGRIESADVNTGSGDVMLSRATGDVTVKTGSGDLRADQVDGQLSLNTGSGDLSVRTVTGNVSIAGASGDVEIDDAHGSIDAHTASGDVRVRRVRGGEVKVRSASGDVRVGVPAGTGVWLDLNTVSGTTTSKLEMSSAPPSGGAAVSLRISTVSGDITIDRVAA